MPATTRITTTTPTAIPTVFPVEEPPELEEPEDAVDIMGTRFSCMLSVNAHWDIEKFRRCQSTMRYL